MMSRGKAAGRDVPMGFFDLFRRKKEERRQEDHPGKGAEAAGKPGEAPESGAGSDGWDDSESVNLSMSKGSVLEESVVGEDRTPAVKDDDAISNEEITKDLLIQDTYLVESDAIRGGMGSVWRVHHNGWNTDLAMKRPQARFFAEGSKKRKETFIHECEAWIRLGLHPNIVSCYYVREIGGVPTIFSEWMENGSLKNRIDDGTLYEIPEEQGTSDEEKKQVLEERLLDIAIQFGRGLHYAHESEDHLIHQDVKPDNLLLTNEWEAKVADFGLAKARTQLETGGAAAAQETGPEGEGASSDEATHMAATGGYTPAYCSGEQLIRETLSRRTDIYSWAVSVLEMYLGKRLWKRGPEAGRYCREYFPQCRVAMPESLQNLLTGCLAEKPDDRPHDFAAVEDALKKIYEEVTGNPYPREQPKAAGDTADSLNNRALSYLDLGKTDEAEALWSDALEKMPSHLPSIYNQGLYLWRSAEIDDEELIRRCFSSGQAEGDEGLAARWLAQINGERGISEETLFENSTNCDVIEGFRYNTSVILTKDGKRLYTVSDKLRCFDTASLACLYEVPVDHISARAFLLTADEKTVLLGGHDRKLKAYAAEDGRALYEAEGHTDSITHMCLHPNGRFCYTAPSGKDLYIRKWEVRTGRCVRTYRLDRPDYHPIHFGDLEISPDGRFLYAVENFRFDIFDEAAGRLADVRIDFEASHAKSVSQTADAGTLYAVSGYKTCIIDAETMKVTKTVKALGYQSRLAGGDRKLLIGDKTLKIFDTGSFRCERTEFGHKKTITSIAVSEDMSLIATGCVDGETVLLWHNPKPEELVRAPWELSVAKSYREASSREKKAEEYAGRIQSLIAEGDSAQALEVLLLAEQEVRTEGASRLRDLRRELTARCRRKAMLGVSAAEEAVSAREGVSVKTIDLNPETGQLAVTDLNPHVFIWDWKLEQRTELTAPKQVFSARFSASGSLLAAGLDGQIMIWKREEGDAYRELRLIRYVDEDEDEAVYRIGFSPDERLVFSGNDRGRSALWDVETGECVYSHEQEDKDRRSEITEFCFSPDGRYVASLDVYHHLCVHDYAGGRTICLLPDEEDSPGTVYDGLTFTRDGGQLILIENANRIRAWNTENWEAAGKTDLPGKGRAGRELLLSPDGNYIVTGGEQIRIWSYPEPEMLFELQVPERSKLGRVGGLALSRDMTRLYTINYNYILSWDIKWELET